MGRSLITALLISASASFTVLANLVLKVGAQGQGVGSVWPLTVVNVRVVAAAAAFGMAFLFYAMLLRRLPLSLAQAIMSMQFVLVILAANLLLGEQISPVRWAGIALMAVGLAIVGFSPDLVRH